MGRPSDYSSEIAEVICDRIAAGESLRKILQDEGMPDCRTVRRWLQHPDRNEFRLQYARAREAQADYFLDAVIEIADDSSGDTKLIEGEEGPPIAVVDHENIARSKLRVDARKWAAGKLAPKKYGDRIIAEHGNLDGKPFESRAATPQQVLDDLSAIFGAAAVSAAAGTAGSNRLVHAGADSSAGEVAGAPARGQAPADPQ